MKKVKEYLKMADVFCGEVTTKLVDDECINEMSRGDRAGNYHVLQDDAYWILIDKDQAEYAAHAINSHDELVNQRNELLKAVEAKKMVQDGWQLVPVEPTIEMVQAITHNPVGLGTRATYKTMLAAAPKFEGGAA